MPARLSSLLLACLLCTACAAGGVYHTSQPSSQLPSAPAWTYTDLRLLDPADASQPELDLLAVYLHTPQPGAAGRIELRLDFLDLGIDRQGDVYIALDYLPGGARDLPLEASADIEWDTLLRLPAEGNLGAYDSRIQPETRLGMRLLRDMAQDSLTLSLELPYPAPFTETPVRLHLRGQVFTALPGTRLVADRSAPFAPWTAPPPQADLLLAFWNTFPAYTPAQALRRWDGAHTGPLGGRHGLANLLRTAQNQSIPIALLDLRTPAWLSALDYAGDWERLAAPAESGLLLLPDSLPSAASVALGDHARSLSQRFDLPAPRSAYAQSLLDLTQDYPLVFIPSPSTTPLIQISPWRGQRVLPIPSAALQAAASLQPTADGLSLDARRMLISAALSARLQDQSLAVLGGSLPDSSWGVPEIARQAFAYIDQHPWIHPLALPDLLFIPLQPAKQLTLAPTAAPLPDLLQQLPSFASSDWLYAEATTSLLALSPPNIPLSPPFTALQDAYRGQAAILLMAAQWNADPQPQAACDQDLDQDGQPECVLASTRLFLVFDLQLGALTHAFVAAPGGAHQFIAPSAQFAIGLSDPAIWQPDLGLAADPQVIPGAFSGPVGAYQPLLEDSRLTLADPVSAIRKTFTLLENGLRVEISAPDAYRSNLPLAVDPWQRFNPDWAQRYAAEHSDNRFVWGIPGELQVEVTSSTPLLAHTFLDTNQFMGRLENPNRDYPPGHYLPFPLALLEFASKETSLEIHIQDAE